MSFISTNTTQEINKIDEMIAFDKAMVECGYHQPVHGQFPDSDYIYQRDADRFAGWMMCRLCGR